MRPQKKLFNFEDLANWIAQFTRDGQRIANQDVVQWFRWLERKWQVPRSKSYLYTVRKRRQRP